MTNDEKVALVKKAKWILNKYFSRAECDDEVCWREKEPCFTHRLVEAHQSFFKRHEADGEYCQPWCVETRDEYWRRETYPCPEAVTTADLLVNGVIMRHYCSDCGDYIPEGDNMKHTQPEYLAWIEKEEKRVDGILAEGIPND